MSAQSPVLDYAQSSPLPPYVPASGAALDTAVVHLAGTESVVGIKTFSDARGNFTGKALDKGGAVFNVMAYGAYNDGSHQAETRAAVIAAESAAVALGGGTVLFPLGRYDIGPFFLSNPYVTWRGATCGPNSLTSDPSTVTQASTLIIRDTGSEFLFIAAWGRVLEDLVFAYPDQIAGTSVAPIVPVVYPYTVRIETGNCAVRRCTFYNSYNAIHIRNGLYRIEECLIFALNNDIYIDRAPDIGWISNINGNTGYPLSTDLQTWLVANKVSWDIRRADGFRFDKIQIGTANIGMRFAPNSTDPGPFDGSAYGTITALDIDGVNDGIWASSTSSGGGGVNILGFNIGAGGAGAGSAVKVVAPSGGYNPVFLKLKVGASRGTWGGGIVNSPQTPTGGMVKMSDCYGYDFGLNPAGVLTVPALPASTVALINPFAFSAQVAITGGTVTAITLGGTATGLTAGTVIVASGQTIAVTYTAAPTWKWFTL